jgi:hypothetical protein
MIRYIAVFTFLVIVGVCSYVVLNPGSYSTVVLCLATFVLYVAILAVAPVWKVYLSPYNIKPSRRDVARRAENRARPRLLISEELRRLQKIIKGRSTFRVIFLTLIRNVLPH